MSPKPLRKPPFDMMTPRIQFGVVFSSMLLTILLVAGSVLGRGEENDGGPYAPLSVYTEVLAHIKSDYVEEPDIKQVTRGALQGLVEYLDPMSSYLSKEQFAEYLEKREASDGGSGLATGLVVHKRGPYTAILSVMPGSPAARAGLESGDLLEAIDDISTRVMPPALLYSRLSGNEGDSVRLLVRTMRQYDEPQEFTLNLSAPELPDVESKMLEDGIGYIALKLVDAKRIEQAAKAMESLKGEGATKLVLDLRENAVGEHARGFELADLFLAEGKLGSVKGQRFEEQVFDAKAEDDADIPLTIIVDSRTAGAAEIAAATLLDAGRAKVVGERTYGLAALQDTIKLDDGAALILSVAKYFRPNGDTLHEQGLEPSNAVEPAKLRRWRNPEERGSEDPFLQKAIETAKA